MEHKQGTTIICLPMTYSATCRCSCGERFVESGRTELEARRTVLDALIEHASKANAAH